MRADRYHRTICRSIEPARREKEMMLFRGQDVHLTVAEKDLFAKIEISSDQL